MARDRQRSKARQRARAAGQQPRGKRSRAKDIGFEDPAIEEAGLTDEAPTPDPLKNISPDVDQVHAAETGVARGPSGEVDLTEEEDDGYDPAGDELEIPPDLVGDGARRRGSAELEGHEPERRDRGKVLSFLIASGDELRRVQWPDRKHVFQATAVVLGFVLVAGGWLGLMDAIWQPLINALL